MDVKHVAKLANLPITSDEEKTLASQLDQILNYVSQLQQVDTKNIEPTSQVTGLTDVAREDVVEPSLELPQDYFRVPAILEDD